MGFSEKKEAKLLAWWLAHSINGGYYYYLTHRALEAQRRKLPGGHRARGTQADVWGDGYTRRTRPSESHTPWAPGWGSPALRARGNYSTENESIADGPNATSSQGARWPLTTPSAQDTPESALQNLDEESSAQGGHLDSERRFWGRLAFLTPKSSKGKALTSLRGLRKRITRSQRKELERNLKPMATRLIWWVENGCPDGKGRTGSRAASWGGDELTARTCRF